MRNALMLMSIGLVHKRDPTVSARRDHLIVDWSWLVVLNALLWSDTTHPIETLTNFVVIVSRSGF